jgi:hypothetical protein
MVKNPDYTQNPGDQVNERYRLLTAVMIALEAMGKFPFWGQALLRHYIRQTGPFAMQR